ncbi:MAG: cytochrome P450 [Dehalococcoidia bacterium]
MEHVIQLFTPTVTADPYATYRRLRDATPVYYDAASRTWALTKYDDVYAALRDHETFSSGDSSGGPTGPGLRLVLITDDPPRHTRFRTLVNRAFTPRRIASLELWITGVVEELLDGFEPEPTDFVSGYAVPLPTRVIAALLGIPPTEYQTFKRWTDDFLATTFAVTPDRPSGQARATQSREMMEYFGRMIAARRSEPADDLITALVAADADGESLAQWEILGFVILLLIAGNETTTNLLANMLSILAGRPDLWQRLRADRSLAEPVVEETLRYHSPVQVLFRRTTRDVKVSDLTIPAGSRVALFYGAANRDPEAYPDPDTFRLDRDLRNHVGFGMGVHYCLGAPLARAEARITLNRMLDRYCVVEPGPEPGTRQTHIPIVLGFERLPLVFRTS